MTGNKRFLDESNGKRPIDVELLDAYLASDENPLVTRKLKPGDLVFSTDLFVYSKIIYHLPPSATDKPESQRKALPMWNFLHGRQLMS